MGKGRIYVPSAEEHGIWFAHRGMPSQIPSRESGTTTGTMLSTSRTNHSAHVKCPPLFQEKLQAPYSQKHPFSIHDNRNSFQDHGVYFGQGLGKHKIEKDKSQHRSDDIVSWVDQKPGARRQRINSIYREDFPIKSGFLKNHHRRYSKAYALPPAGFIPPPAKITMWVPSDEIVPRTYLQTLADTQEPHLKVNPWKYSYHSRSFALPSSRKHLNSTV